MIEGHIRIIHRFSYFNFNLYSEPGADLTSYILPRIRCGGEL